MTGEKLKKKAKEVLPTRKLGARPIPRRRTYYQPQTMPTHNIPLSDRVCVLTGASGLLGTEFIKRHALDYKIVAITHNNDLASPPSLVDPLFSSVPIDFPEIATTKCDLSKPDEIDMAVAEIIHVYGKVDLLINAACYRGYWMSMELPRALDTVEMAFLVNVMAPMRLVASLTQQFWSKQPVDDNTAANRNIVNISSTAGSFVYPDSGQGVYSATKAALNYASHHMASELWEYGLRVNIVAPNTFPGIVPTGRVLDQIIAFDQSDQTGELVIIDRET